MSDLPDVWLLSRMLEPCVSDIVSRVYIVGGPYKISIDNKYTEHRNGIDELTVLLEHKPAVLSKIERHGRWLIFEIAVCNRRYVYVIVSGFDIGFEQTPHTTHVIAVGNRQICLSDSKRRGKIAVCNNVVVDAELATEGCDMLEVVTSDFAALLNADARPIITVLGDNRVVSGLGTMIRSEVLYYARINPLCLASSLTRDQCETLCKAVKYVCLLVIQQGGTTTYKPAIYGQRQSLGGTVHNYMFGGRNVYTLFSPNNIT